MNLPPPASPGNVISTAFMLPVAGYATVEVFDVRGRRVRRLHGDAGPSGERGRLDWDGTDDHGSPVEAGIYWVRIRSGGASRSVKVVRLPGGGGR